MNPITTVPQFAVVEPTRTSCDYYARVLEQAGRLRVLTIGTRHGIAGVSSERTRLKPVVGLAAYIGARLLPPFQGEAFRFRLLPWIDRWSRRQLRPGDHVFSSYGYANECFKFAHRHGGKTLIDAGNSHIENFWTLVSEEHRRWNCPYPPFSPYWYERSRAMLPEVDYVFSPSSYVTESFLARGFKPQQILRSFYPVDLSLFQPPSAPRPKDRPLTVINTGGLSLRKGSPYLLEAFRLLQRQHPSARLLLTRVVRNDVEPVLGRYRDLPIEWAPSLPHDQLAQRLRSADVFVLPSIEEGLARTALEAMACGLQVVLTPNTGSSDFVQPGVNGEIIPIRDPAAIVEAILKCWERIQSGHMVNSDTFRDRVSGKAFEKNFLGHLGTLGLL